MAKSDQVPLSSPRKQSAHDFSLKPADWDAAVFDDAACFAVIDYTTRTRVRNEFTTFREAMEFTSDKLRSCIYAISKSGRNALLDRPKWAEWAERERRADSSF